MKECENTVHFEKFQNLFFGFQSMYFANLEWLAIVVLNPVPICVKICATHRYVSGVGVVCRLLCQNSVMNLER